MLQYKSQANLEKDLRTARRLAKQRGNIPFQLDGNQSGRICVKFPKEFSDVPIILTNTVVTSGPEFHVSTVLTSVTTADFTVNIQNASDTQVTGSVNWVSA